MKPLDWLKARWISISLLIVGIGVGVLVIRVTADWSQRGPWLLVIIILALVVYMIAKVKASGMAEDGSSMPVNDRRLLTGYLLLVGFLIVYMLISLCSVEFPEPSVHPEQPPMLAQSPTNTPTPAASPTVAPAGAARTQQPTQPTNPNPPPQPSDSPVLKAVFPHHTVGTKPDEMLTLYGENFTKESKVRLNGKETASAFQDSHLLTVPLQASHLASVGSLAVDVQNPGNRLSNAMTVPVLSPKVHLNVFFFWSPLINREVWLLLIVLFAGALGSYVHALKSLGDYIGNRQLRASWFWWYITRPFLGMAMGLIFYAVLRGGFLAGSPADSKSVSAYGVLTVGALVGMFADKAAQKLAEVFDVVFKAPDTRSGKLDAPVIDKAIPNTVPVGSAEQVIKLSGTRLGKVTAVRVEGEERKPENVSEKELTFKLKADDMKTAGKLNVEVVSEGGASPTIKIYVSDLKIVLKPLPEAKVGQPYSHQLETTGGTKPVTWTVQGPQWLKSDASGKLTGTPAATDVKDANEVKVKAVDAEGATAEPEKPLTLKVVP